MARELSRFKKKIIFYNFWVFSAMAYLPHTNADLLLIIYVYFTREGKTEEEKNFFQAESIRIHFEDGLQYKTQRCNVFFLLLDSLHHVHYVVQNIKL